MKKIRAGNDRRSLLACAMIFPCVVLIVLAGAAVSHAALDVSPVSVSAAKGQNTRVTLTWRITGEASALWTSTGGTFEDVSGSTFGSPTGPLSINVGASGNGSVTESLLIPSSIVNTVAQGGELSFFYRRDFSPPPIIGGSVSKRLNISIVVSQAAGPVSLRRVELFFEEGGKRTNEITVGRNTKGLTALADLYVNGTGYMEGFWEVDGRRIENFRKYASSGSKVTLRSSEVPGIPTFRPGLHSVRLVVTNPAPGFILPQLGYIVTSGDAKVVRSLHLLLPENMEKVNGDTVFSWKPVADAVYILTYTRDPGEEVVLTAQTKKPAYQIPGSLLAERFTLGVNYLWQVQGFDAEGELVSESRARKVTFGE